MDNNPHDNTLPKITQSIPKPGMTMVPPIHSLNTAFEELGQAVARVQALDIPMPMDRNGVLERLNTEVELDTLTLRAMEAMNGITDMLNDMANKAEGKSPQ